MDTSTANKRMLTAFKHGQRDDQRALAGYERSRQGYGCPLSRCGRTR